MVGFDYNPKVMEYFLSPRNIGEIPDPDGVGTVGNPQCGDVMRLYIKIEKGKIVDAKFQTFGCAAAIASSSILTEMVIGKSITEALKISNQDVVNELGGLPPIKMHCSVLAKEALEAAVQDYRDKITT